MWISVIFCIVLFLILSYLHANRGMVFIKGSDGKNYIIRKDSDNIIAVNTLVLLRKKLTELIDYIYNKFKHNNDIMISRYMHYIKRIKDRLPYVQIKETSMHSNHTSFSVNKGEELHFCIRSKLNNKFHSINELLYVAIHEIAHIGCPEEGHTNLFYDINKFILKQAVEFNIYQFRNYNIHPVEYCGINLNHTILDK
uniref:WLM domain-containing protein n=1 Tax=viral metagenome TaxID=1070528 RepID=A0A6C0LYV7_9ZZZZ